ncbi:shikimate kinase 1 [Roseburia sp. CAG:309]|nr:shikimate kinase 1 [Roseburia sp. CAG:309]
MISNIILIGMPGAGKSTIGVVLAKRLGFSFLDTDLVIQEKQKMLLHEILEEYGQDGFNEVENAILSEIFAKNSIIATGGSAVYGSEAMQNMKELGKIVYLKISYEELEHRLGDLEERGVSMKEGQTLRSLYEERLPLYEKYADHTIDCDGKCIREIVYEICEIANKE